jgi:hypothetical protein
MNRGSMEKQIEAKTGLYANIHAKRKRIKAGSKGAPTEKNFKKAKKTTKKKRKV